MAELKTLRYVDLRFGKMKAGRTVFSICLRWEKIKVDISSKEKSFQWQCNIFLYPVLPAELVMNFS